MKPVELDDDALGVLVDSKLRESTTWFNSKLSTERERVMRYYNGEYPKRTSPASSSYISTEVYDGVEAAKAQMLEVFAAGQEIVRFDPQTPDDVDGARQATQYVDYVVFRQNDGYKVFNETIHDALIARIGIVKVYWDERIDYVEHDVKDLHEVQVMGLASMEEVHSLDAAQDPSTGLFSGKMTKKVDRSQVRIEVINPEEFSIEPQARTLDPRYFCVHTCMKTVDELIREGYDKGKLEAYNLEDDTWASSNPEVLARFQQIDQGMRAPNDYDEADENRKVVVHECYIKCRRKGDKVATLYKVVRCGAVTLEIEEVEDHPFVVYTPLPIPHSFYGNSFANRIIPAQNVRTVLTRSIVDHATITNNPRLQVLKGGLTNPRELLDNRLGGLVNVTRPDAVTPMVQAPLNPYVYQTLELIKTQLEETTGISNLSQGLNKDAISKQNSAAMVEQLVSLSQTRQKIMARNFANGFLVPLYLKIYNIVLQKEKRKSIIEVTGNWTEIDTSRWFERKAASISLHLGYGEADREAQKLVQLGTMLNQDPVLQHCFTPQNRYNLARDAAKLGGVFNINDYLTPPDKIPQQKPDPMAMQHIQNETAKAQAATVTAQANLKKVDMHGAIEEMKANLAKMQRDFDNQIKLREEQRKDADISNKIDVSQREMHLAETNPVGQESVTVAPH